MATKVVFSEYQKNVFNFVTNGKGNAAISAVAGSGKTFTIVNALRFIPKDKTVLFLAFNKSIVSELKLKVGDLANVEVMTLHAFGLKVLNKICRRYVDNYKQNKIKEELLSYSNILTIDNSDSELLQFKNNAYKLYNLCRINLLKNGDKTKISDLAFNHNIECVSDEIEAVNEMLKNAYKDTKEIDFTDMLVLPLGMKTSITYDFVFIDECQDLSAAQRALMLKALKPNGRFIAVGDRRQAINGFAGASCDSFDLIANLPNTTELPLSVNYRCGSKIIELAKDIVPEITAHENAISGEVNEIDNLKTVTNNDMIICRLSAPLVSVCLKLIAKGKTAQIKGKDIGEGLINLVVKMKAKNIPSLFTKLDNELEKIEKSMPKNIKYPKETGKYLGMKDKIECLSAIAERANGIAELKRYIQDLFSDEAKKNAIMLSTIHKAKGLEADNVFILCPEKLPLRYKGQQTWELEQEMNLKYVAITRAKKVLNFVNVDKANISKIEL